MRVFYSIITYVMIHSFHMNFVNCSSYLKKIKMWKICLEDLQKSENRPSHRIPRQAVFGRVHPQT